MNEAPKWIIYVERQRVCVFCSCWLRLIFDQMLAEDEEWWCCVRKTLGPNGCRREKLRRQNSKHRRAPVVYSEHSFILNYDAHVWSVLNWTCSLWGTIQFPDLCFRLHSDGLKKDYIAYGPRCMINTGWTVQKFFGNFLQLWRSISEHFNHTGMLRQTSSTTFRVFGNITKLALHSDALRFDYMKFFILFILFVIANWEYTGIKCNIGFYFLLMKLKLDPMIIGIASFWTQLIFQTDQSEMKIVIKSIMVFYWVSWEY